MGRASLVLLAMTTACAPVGVGRAPATPEPVPDERTTPDPQFIPETETPGELLPEFEAPTDLDLPDSMMEPEYVDQILNSPLRDQPEIRDRIDYWVEFWSTRGKSNFQRYLDRMGRLEPLVDREIEALGLPRSLRYLPIVESGYNPTVFSRVRAAGLWQFMSGTARWKGLRVDGLVDQRLDPVAATPIALQYLAELHEQFGSWFLALAAYNSGPGRVAGVIRRNAPDAVLDDALFWELSDELPNETAHFVPRFFAAATLAQDPERYGLRTPTEVEPLAYETVDVDGAASLDVIAETVGVEEEVIRELNPHLRQRVTPPGRTYAVRVPPGRAEGFAERFAEVPANERVTFVQHRVARGETLSHIASRYGIGTSALRAANPGVSPRRLQIGQSLIIPTGGVDRARITAAAEPQAGATEQTSSGEVTATASGGLGVRVTHVVQSGESPWTISRRYGVSVSDLLTWNDLTEGQTIYPGLRLEVREARIAIYRVQSGDTLSGIAMRHGVSTAALAAANGLTLRSVIKPGDEVTIPGSER